MRTDVKRAKELWFDRLYSLQMISDEIGVSRQAVRKALIKAGVDTSKAATWQTVTCSNLDCRKEFKKRRAQARRTMAHYCSKPCYYAGTHNPDYVDSRQGQRIARKVVAQAFDLQPGHVVHHEDGNDTHNDINNLMAFSSQAEHMRWHRGTGAVPVFNGTECSG